MNSPQEYPKQEKDQNSSFDDKSPERDFNSPNKPKMKKKGDETSSNSVENVEEQLSEALGKDANVEKSEPVYSSEKLEPKQEKQKSKSGEKQKEEIRSELSKERESKEDIKGEGRQAREEKLKKTALQRIKTYKNDINKVMKKKATSVAGIMTTAQKKKRKDRKEKEKTEKKKVSESKSNKKMVYLILGVLLIIAIVGTAYFLIIDHNSSSTYNVKELEVSSIIKVDDKRQVSVVDRIPLEILQDIEKIRKDISLPLGKIMQVYLTKGKQNNKKVIDSKSFLQSVSEYAKPEFRRSLKPEFLLGIHSFNRNQSFILFKVDSFQQAFSGMMEWEEDIKNDLYPLFESSGPIDFTSESDSEIVKNSFEDIVIQNHDVRALKTRGGDIVMMYSFLNMENLIITTNKHTFKEVLTRIRRAGKVR